MHACMQFLHVACRVSDVWIWFDEILGAVLVVHAVVCGNKQLGEFNILMDKRNVYDWNTHIHLLARGPGIKGGSTWKQPATQVW